MSRFVVLGLTLAALAGCQERGGPPPAPPGVPVSGKVLLPTGSPLSGGRLVLRPVEGIHGATGKVQKDGTFTLTDTDGKEAVVPGKYQVYVTFTDPADQASKGAVNRRYQNTEDGDSDVTVEVEAKATTNLVVRLKR